METSLHRALKERYACGDERRFEVRVEGFRIDAVDDTGRLVEIQSGPLGPLRPKLRALLPRHCVKVVKPLVLERRVIKKSKRFGQVISARRSPKRGTVLDAFNDLVGIVRVFPHANLEIELLAITIDEVRVLRRRRPGYAVIDRCLDRVCGATAISQASDLWSLLPAACVSEEAFSTRDLAHRLNRPLWFSQRVAYCLRHAGAAHAIGKAGNLVLYRRAV
jgi:hypothetical protein